MTKVIILMCISLVLNGCMSSHPQTDAFKMEPRISVITLGVSDLRRSYHFYKDGLGFPTKMTPDGGIVLFDTTTGTRLMLYPYAKLAGDATFKDPANAIPKGTFPGFTLGHCVRQKEQVDAVLAQAERAGGIISKKPATASWGGYSGYFQDPDGYSWEVLYSNNLKSKSDGSVIVE
jgi:catechol 2,3-dioxygenase-like lactoylglutathione lyase family enzyme